MTSRPTSPVVPRIRIARVGMMAGVAGLGLLPLAGCVEQAQAHGTSTSTSETSPSTSSTYADGTYRAEAQYQAPSGMESVAVELTLADGVIASVSSSADSSDREAAHFQSMFAKSISGAVVGRELSSLSVTRVAGASLTSNGFNSALEQIRAEASG